MLPQNFKSLDSRIWDNVSQGNPRRHGVIRVMMCNTNNTNSVDILTPTNGTITWDESSVLHQTSSLFIDTALHHYHTRLVFAQRNKQMMLLWQIAAY